MSLTQSFEISSKSTNDYKNQLLDAFIAQKLLHTHKFRKSRKRTFIYKVLTEAESLSVYRKNDICVSLESKQQIENDFSLLEPRRFGH